MSFLFTFQDLLLETAPWLLLGLFSAGVVKAWIPEALVFRWLGGNGWKPILRGALVGTPLPLCSCGVIPMAMGLRRKGASKAATVSFLVATPETGVDSIAISWAMLGPVLTVARPVAAIISAVVSGLLVLSIDSRSEKTAPTASCANPSPPDAPDARPACCTSQCASTTREVINSNAMAT
ncbi:MAG TPA: permease, partial [Magnetococcales bacterium]|nr:permease [Magnetococcales bacterium]